MPVPTATQLFSVLAVVGAAAALDNGVVGVKKPQMGYNSWYDLKCTSAMNETTIRAIARKMNQNGLHQAGYTYLNLDGKRDCA